MVRIARWIERFFGRLSDGNLCVTKAMQAWLKKEWGIEASVLYDRAPSHFHQATLQEKHTLFHKILPSLRCPDVHLTEVVESGEIKECEDRPAILVSSTSWTADEDFGILLRALTVCDSK